MHSQALPPAGGVPARPDQPSGPRVRPSPREAGACLLVATAVLFAMSGPDWWALAVGVGGLLIGRLALPMLPASARPLVGPAVLIAVVLYLTSVTDWWSWGTAAGAAVVTLASARAVRGHRQWGLLLVGLALATGCGIGAALAAHQERLTALGLTPADRAEAIRQLRPTTADGALTGLQAAVATGRPALVCGGLLFTAEAERAFAAAAGAPDCAGAVAELHTRVSDPAGYAAEHVTAEAITHHPDGTVTIDGCQLSTDYGPRLGALTVHATTGRYQVVGYRVCAA